MKSITCPHCGTEYVERQAVTKQKRRGLFGYSGGGLTLRSEATQHFGGVGAQPAYQQPAAAPGISIAPGTTREIEHKRPETPVDVMTFGIKAGLYGCATALVSTSVFMFPKLQAPWFVPFVVLPIAAGLAWFPVAGRAQGLITMAEKITKIDLDGDGKVADRPVTHRAKGELKIGKRTIYTDFPINDLHQWHLFCQMVVESKYKKFSQNQANAFELDLGPIIADWQTSLLIDPSTVGVSGKAPELTASGRAMVRLFATTPPPVVL